MIERDGVTQKIEIPRVQLEEYLGRGMSAPQIAEVFGCGRSTIKRRIAEFGLRPDSAFKYVGSQRTRLLYINGAMLSFRQRSILTGALLGDGCLSKQKESANARFQFGQGIAHRDYVRWMATELEPFTSWVNEREKAILLGTAYYSEFTRYHDMFYPDGKKIVPDNIGEHIDEQALAVWFMDDGSTYASSSLLSTQGFTKMENELLCRVLENQFGIEAKVKVARKSMVDGRTLYRLYVSKRGHCILHEIVDPLVHKDFEHKRLPQGKVRRAR